MTEVGLCILLLWAWAQWRNRKPVAQPRMMDVWIFSYTERGRRMEYVVAETTEVDALTKYFKAGLDPKKITGSRAAKEPVCE